MLKFYFLLSRLILDFFRILEPIFSMYFFDSFCVDYGFQCWQIFKKNVLSIQHYESLQCCIIKCFAIELNISNNFYSLFFSLLTFNLLLNIVLQHAYILSSFLQLWCSIIDSIILFYSNLYIETSKLVLFQSNLDIYEHGLTIILFRDKY